MSPKKYWLIAVNARCENRRRKKGPPVMDMSISPCPSMRPRSPFSACMRASSTMRARRVYLKTTARIPIISSPPANSAATNCHPSSTSRTMPSSKTRFVLANSKRIALARVALPDRANDRLLGDDGLDDTRDDEPERKRPEDLPEHEEGHLQRLPNRVEDEHDGYACTSRWTALLSSLTLASPSPARMASATQCFVWSARSRRATLSSAALTALTCVRTSMQ